MAGNGKGRLPLTTRHAKFCCPTAWHLSSKLSGWKAGNPRNRSTWPTPLRLARALARA